MHSHYGSDASGSLLRNDKVVYIISGKKQRWTRNAMHTATRTCSGLLSMMEESTRDRSMIGGFGMAKKTRNWWAMEGDFSSKFYLRTQWQIHT